MRVAVTQFATTLNVEENLATCIRMIDEAAVCAPDLIVLPAFCNTLFCNEQPANVQASYIDHKQAWQQALPLDGIFLQAIAEQAKKYHSYIMINVTLRRDALRDLSGTSQNGEEKSNISITTCLFAPLGELIHQTDKQTLIGYEKAFFSNTNPIAEVAATSLGKLGLLVGDDGATFEVSRNLALQEAQLLGYSMNSFALDRTELYGPARACENNVFAVIANKVGPLLSPAVQEQSQDVTTSYSKDSIPEKYLVGAGQSSIISPSGKVLAKIAHNKEGFIFADIELTDVGIGLNNKLRPDGSNAIKQRRPELYQALAMQNTPLYPLANLSEDQVPVTANAAIFATYKSNEHAIEDVCHYIENNLSDIIQLPELFFIADKAILNNTATMSEVAKLSNQLITQISAVLRPFQYVCTSLVIEGKHQAVLISEHGLFATQQQLHFCQRYQWTELGNDVNIIELPLEQGNINVAMLTADDTNIPEIVNITAQKKIHVLLVPFDIQEPCEVESSLLARAVENRICIIAASREKSFANELSANDTNHNGGNKKKIKSSKSTGLIINLMNDGALCAQWKSGKFTGYINPPLIKHQQGKITKAVLHPVAACRK